MSFADRLRDQDYPCRYPFKLICEADAVAQVRAQIMLVCPPAYQLKFKERASSSGKYISLTAEITAQQAEDIEAVYQSLKDIPGIVTSL